MRSRPLQLRPVLFTLALLAMPAVAPALQARLDRARAGTAITNPRIEVTDLATRRTTAYDPGRGDQVPLTVGQRVLVRVVATVRDSGGRAVEVPADFQVTAGDWRIDVAPRGGGVVVAALEPNSVDRGKTGSRSQLLYRVRGVQADHHDATGRVTFDIQPTVAAAPAPDTRWQRSTDVARDLATLVPSLTFDPAWVQRVYQGGYDGARTLASQLADLAVRRGTYRDLPPTQVLAELYRNLLGREGSSEDLWRQDPGFRANVDVLRDRGLAAMVDSLVTSEEYRQRYDFAGFDVLPTRQDALDLWRDRVDRGAATTRPN